MAKLAAAPALGAGGVIRAGSSPVPGTRTELNGFFKARMTGTPKLGQKFRTRLIYNSRINII